MSIYTVVRARPLPEISSPGYACLGRKTRQEALNEAQAHFTRIRDEAEFMLGEIEDGDALVTIEDGYRRTVVLETLEPKS